LKAAFEKQKRQIEETCRTKVIWSFAVITTLNKVVTLYGFV